MSHAIGIFDSGIGGLTVMRQVCALLPYENIVYFGDTARVPYGEKSPETIIRYSIENAQFLISLGVKAIVIACNTATALAIDALRERFNVPIFGVIQPGALKAVEMSRSGNIAVLGTRGTINSGVYEREILSLKPHAKVLSIACPLLAPLVEENFIDHIATRMILREYLKPIDGSIDTILLGCTHYPLLAHVIQEEVGPLLQVIDSATELAGHLKKALKEHQIENKELAPPQYQFFVSDDPIRFQEAAKGFFNCATVLANQVCPQDRPESVPAYF